MGATGQAVAYAGRQDVEETNECVMNEIYS